MSNSLILVDGKNQLFIHNSVNQYLSRSTDGHPTGAIYGCLNRMISIHTKIPDAAIVWVWDGIGETWRHKFMQDVPKLEEPDTEEEEFSNDLAVMGQQFLSQSMNQFKITDSDVPFYKKPKKKYGYKANRARPEDKKKSKNKSKYPEDQRERALLQIPILKLILEGCGIRNYEVEGLECDDLLAMLVKKIIKLDHEAEVFIHSGDKDYYQLLQYKQVRIITSIKDGKLNKVRKEDVFERYGVEAKDWAKHEAFTGGHNNVGHLKGIGSKTARKMLEEGFDPSKSSIPESTDIKYMKFRDPQVWSYLHNNYKLCRLVDDYKDELLSEEVRKRLEPMFTHFDDIKRFYRSSKGKTPEAFRKVSFLLAQYEMASILSRRVELFDIP